jgi:glucose/arabinose dehydrogenase
MKAKLKIQNSFKTVLMGLSLIAVSFIPFSCNEDDDGVPGRDTDNDGLEVSTLAEGVDTPWQFAFAPDGRIFFTERPGQIRVIENGNLREEPWMKLDSIVEEVGESGLFGITLDPQFAQNGLVYVAYTYATSKSPLVLVNRIIRYKENATTKVPAFDKILIDNIPGNYLHNVGALKFGPDGKLYAGVGEIFKPELAQDLTSLNGKILRMNPDGSVPPDNPFPGSYVYSYGHRNPQGLVFHPETQRLYITEHGPSEVQGCCQDELNLIQPGKNYGWPIITGSKTQTGLETPIYYSGDTATWAPAGTTILTQGKWKGSMVFTGLRGQALYRAVLNSTDPTKVDTVEKYLFGRYGRLRTVEEGPDGTLYIGVSNQDGRGRPDEDDDKILTVKIE